MTTNWSDVAIETTLAIALDASATSATLASATGFPLTNFYIVIDPGASTEEVLFVATRVGTALSGLVRAAGVGSVAHAHNSGATTVHAITATDLTNLQTLNTNEATTRAAADTALQSAITSEASTRGAADTALQSNIDTEASTRGNADTTLQSNIDAETSARANADTTLQSAITAEASIRGSADSTLQGNIDAEASARIAADSSEASTRASGDSTNATAISTHAARTDNPHSTTAAQVGAYTSGAVDSLLAAKVPTSRQLTFNGVALDLSTDRSWTITGGQGMKQTTADATGATDATAQLQADLTTAAAATHKRLYLPAGTYKLAQVGGTLFSMTTDNVEIFGDGIGKTILQVPANTVLTSDLIIFQLKAKHQWLHDFSIQIGAGASGAFDMHAIQVYQDSYYARLNRIEISGVYGNGTAGGGGIETYQPYDRLEVNTTLGTNIASGVQTVTPPSMQGIYKGRSLIIGGTTETIQVTSITETTFTATFANSHTSGNTVTGYSNARQFALIQDCIVRDSYKCSAFIINSAANTFLRSIALHVGSNSAQHGFYIQAGQNDFISCKSEGVGGYSYHEHIATNVTDASGNRYISCESINPGTQHVVADTSASNGTNPDVPNATDLNRYVLFDSCLFRRTKNGPACQGVFIQCDGMVSNCLFDDAVGASSATMLAGSVGKRLLATGNLIRVVQTLPSNCLGIVCYGGILSNNEIIGWNTNNTSAMRLEDGGRANGNHIVMSAGTGIVVNGNNVVVENNVIDNSGGSGISFNQTTANMQNCRIHDNRVNCTAGARGIDFFAAGNTPTGSIYNNYWAGTNSRIFDVPAGLNIYNNDGGWGFRGNATYQQLTAANGRLIAFPKGTNVLTSGLLVKISAGILVTIGTGDTTFFGVATSTTDSTSANTLIVGELGSEATVACDGAWTAGNVAIVSTTSAGKVHDNGTTVPAAPASYGYFLDTGGGAGNARVLLMKTL